jgi:hypothetical protein
MMSLQLTWAAACTGSSPIVAERSAIPMTAVGVRVDRVRHVPWAQRKQGRSVFIGTNPIATSPSKYMVQANLRPELVHVDDSKVWGPDPWRPPPV